MDLLIIVYFIWFFEKENFTQSTCHLLPAWHVWPPAHRAGSSGRRGSKDLPECGWYWFERKRGCKIHGIGWNSHQISSVSKYVLPQKLYVWKTIIYYHILKIFTAIHLSIGLKLLCLMRRPIANFGQHIFTPNENNITHKPICCLEVGVLEGFKGYLTT